MENYSAKDIKILKGLEPVRKRPGMYIGSVGTDGLHHLIWEVIDNSVDEYLSGYADEINVVIDSSIPKVTISDNGRGIPVDILKEEKQSALRIILQSLHSGGKFDNTSYKTAGGLHGVGLACVNALSSEFIVFVERDGFLYKDEYLRGVAKNALNKGKLDPIGKSKKHGTKIEFIPDDTIFETTEFKEGVINKRLHEIACLNDGLRITLNYDGIEKTFNSGGGIEKLLEEETEDSDTITGLMHLPNLELNDSISSDIVFQYVDENGENIKSYVNNIPTRQGGTHETEFKGALTRTINTYAKDLNVNKGGFTGNEIRTGLVAVINLKIQNPSFVGQTKDKLDVPKLSASIGQHMRTQIEYYFDRNKKKLEKLLNVINDISKDKKKEDDLKLLKKKKKDMATISSKLSAPTSRNFKERELFLVEGDSAGGSAKQARDRKTQGILPLRGKILNVEKVSLARALKNQEISTIIQVLGAGFGKDFNSQKLKYSKVVILSDADVDGKHIQILLLTMFYKYMKDLIVDGHLYIAVPPLYRIIDSKNKSAYLYSDEELESYKKAHKNIKINRFKGLGEMNPSELKATTMDKNTRKLKLITVDDIMKANQYFKDIMGTNAEYRKSLLLENEGAEIWMQIQLSHL